MATGVWQPAAVLALAPDASSAKSGQDLAQTRKWPTLGRDDEGLWGECQGSGSKPYQTVIELAEPAFHCSCPSRKFPCKHALGLFLLFVNQPAALTEGTPPAWALSWREGRAKRAEKKAEKAAAAEAPPTPESEAEAAKKAEQKAKRQAARSGKMAAGLEELGVWLSDVVRQGLVAVPEWSSRTWEDRARRLVDAQLPALASHVRRLADLPMTGMDWQGLLLERLARLQLLIEGAKRMEALPEPLQADLRNAMGVPVDQDALRAGPTVRDTWQVLGIRMELLSDDRLRLQRTWLLGRQTGRVALLLDFAHLSQPRSAPQAVPGTAIEASLAFYGGSQPERALLVERLGDVAALDDIDGATTIDDAWDRGTAFLTANPWTERTLIALREVTIESVSGTWWLRDANDAALPLASRFAGAWELLSRSGGRPFAVAGEFDGRCLLPLGVRLDGAYQPLTPDETESQLPVASPAAGPSEFDAAWRELTSSALVGVDRRPPNWALLEPVLGVAATGLADREPPARLLDAAGALSLMLRSGRLLDRACTSRPEQSPVEDLPAVVGAPALRLRLLLRGTHSEFLPEWLERAAEQGLRVPDESLSALLDLARGNTALRPKVDAVLGRRGHWLASQNPTWSFVSPEAPAAADLEEVWQTGKSAERLSAFRAKREHDPAGARAWLEATWASEPADERLRFVSALSENLGTDDEPFLERSLDDRAKTVRRAAAGLLSRCPESRFALRMIDRARAALRWDVTPSVLAVVPPASCPADWVRDGIEPKLNAEAKAENYGERAWWLKQLVAAVPIRAWGEILHAAPAEIVVAASKTEWALALREGWTEAVERDGDVEWASALMEWPETRKEAGSDRTMRVFRLLPADLRDRHIQKMMDEDPRRLRRRHAAWQALMACDAPLGVDLARAVVSRLQGELSEGRTRERHMTDYETLTLLNNLPALLPAAVLAEAERGWPSSNEGSTSPQQIYTQSMIDELVAALRFRREMHEEFQT